MVLASDKRCVIFHVFPQITGEKLALNMGQKANGDFFFGVRVGYVFLLAGLPSGEKGLAAFSGQVDGPTAFLQEVTFADLLAVDQGEHKAVAPPGTEFFKQVKRKAESAGPVGVEKADIRVKPDAL